MHEPLGATADLAEVRASDSVNLLYPLNEFYEQSGLVLPAAIRIEGSEMPEPYRSLLVHEHDLTPTLEAAYHQKMNLRVLEYSFYKEVFARQIVLVPEGGKAPVSFGAIKIYLDPFPARARALVLERKRPLGSILHSEKIEHASRPDAYFAVAADSLIQSALELTESARLFGRRNVLWSASGQKLAQVLEILPSSRRELTNHA